MIGGIAGNYSYYGAYNPYRTAGGNRQADAAQSLQGGQRAVVLAARRAAAPETPVEPVRPVPAVNPEEVPTTRLGPVLRKGADPAEMAVRMRIRPYEDPAQAARNPQAAEEERPAQNEKVGAEGVQAAAEEGRCQTCENRKYQDESDDMGVSFQSPTRIAPEQVAAAVRGHENEHVVREQAKAKVEDRKVVSQSVTLHTDICPECGKVFISGGTTRTVTKADTQPENAWEQVRPGAEEAELPTAG